MKLLIDYEQLVPAKVKVALRRVLQLFARADLKVLDVSTSGKSQRLAGVSFREVTLAFADSQKLSLRVKVTGDVYEVRINGKKVPVSDQEDPARAVGELVKMLDTGRARFQKRLAAMQMRPPEGAKTAAPRMREALTSQIAAVDEQIEAAKEELAELQAA